MSQTLLFCAVLASQIAVITGFLSWRVALNLRYVLKHCPPATHPRLYPMPRDYYERALRRFTWLNVAVGIVGVAIALVRLWATHGQWDAAVIVPFFLLQMVPSLCFDLSFRKHYMALATREPPRQRTVELHRRRMLDLISPTMLVTTVAVQGAFVAFLLDYRRHQFPWFTAAGNIAGFAFIDLLMFLVVGVMLRARRVDHFETDGARRERLRRLVQPMWIVGIVMPVLVTVQLVMKLDSPRIPDFVVASAFVQAIAIALRWAVLVRRPAQTDFDVYRQDAGVRP